MSLPLRVLGLTPRPAHAPTARPGPALVRAGLTLLLLLLATACGTDADAPSAQDATGGGDAAQLADAAAQGDSVATDAPVVAAEPKAKVYLHDPVTDKKTTTEVTLVPPTTLDGALTGPFAAVKNCLNEEGGESMATLGFEFGALCKEVATVRPDPDGHYLGVTPPSDASDPNDGFAELMMYHHVHAIHAYFKGIHGLEDLDYPLPALVNVNLWFDPKIAATHGLEGGWTGYPNAAFMPPKGFKSFNLPERDEGHIIFGQYQDHDLSYDATVIYHEYTHAIVGTTRLSGLFADKYGLNNQPGAMNEAFADYFAATMMNHPVIGTFGIAFAGDHLVRDLSVTRKCPEDLTTELHADGRIFAAALWAIRQKVGADFADRVILRALQAFTNATSFESAANLIVIEAEKEDFNRSEQMLLILKKAGLIGCVRATTLTTWAAKDSESKARFKLEGSETVGGGLSIGVPAYKQWKLPVKSGTAAVTIRWHAEAAGTFNNPNLRLYLQDGGPVLIGGGGSTASFASVVPEPDPSREKWQSITLASGCLPKTGQLWMLLTNLGVKPATIDEIEVEVHTSVPSSKVNLATCKK